MDLKLHALLQAGAGRGAGGLQPAPLSLTNVGLGGDREQGLWCGGWSGRA